MNYHRMILAAAAAAVLSSCYVTPVPGPYGPRSPWSPGGAAVVPAERHPRGPYSPGGYAVTPRERHPRSPWSPGGAVVLPREARRVYVRGNVYYTHGGVWYRNVNGRVVIVANPYR